MSFAGPASTAGGRRSVQPLPDLLTLVLLLAVLAPVGVTFGQLSFWRGFTQPWPAFLAGAFCCGLAAMQRRSSPWLLAVVALGVFATALTLYRLMPGPTLLLRYHQLRTLLHEWLMALWNGEQVYDDLAVDAWSTAAAWCVGMWAAWAALRAGWHWLVLTAAGALLAVSVRYLPHWPAAGLVVFVFAALLLLARLNHLRVVADAAARGVPRPPRNLRTGSAQTVAVCGGAAALVAGAWLLPAARWKAPAVFHVTPPAPRLPERQSVAISTADELRVLHDFGPVLPFEGEIALGDQLVATVEAPSPGYLYGMSYDRYESSGWVSTAADGPHRLALAAAAPGSIPSQAERVSASLSEGATYQDSQPVDETVHPAERVQILFAAGPPVGVPASVAAGPAGSTAGNHGLEYAPQSVKGAPAGEFSALVAESQVSAGTSYTTSGLISSATPDVLRNAAVGLPDWVKANYLQLPDSVPARVRAQAAQLTASAASTYDKALAVQAYLRSFPYDEAIPAPPPGEDGVDYLLFVAKRGYCDYFASAMAVMLRSVGIPARIVVGYVAHDGTGQGLYQVRERDAHAWTEVYFPGYGWQRFDPTPGGAADYAPNAGSAAPLPEQAVSTQTVPTPPPPAAPQPAAPTPASPSAVSASRSHGRHASPAVIAVWLSLIALLASSGLYLWARYHGNPRRAALTAWRFATLAGRIAERRQRRTETAYEYAAALTARSPDAWPLRRVAGAYTRARFGRRTDRSVSFPGLWQALGRGIAGLFTAKLPRIARRRS